MPANKKYLTKDPWQRTAKLSAAIIGGYLIATLLHVNAIFFFPGHRASMVTFKYTLYLVWIPLFIVPYLYANGWRCWSLYLVLIILLSLTAYLGNLYFPIV